ncbi:hypothetical protein [Paraburkholderia humisilvae]|uniref:hypothetical protein n=1 Tax=Paraburkholderia humisilvae TaxID=627669 RepID=UPI0015815353|nr:hypothetical protein [Paraburkholderia humisilvae]
MDQKAILAHVIELTARIDEAAERGDWISAARFAEQRTPMIEAIVLPDDPAALETLRRVLATILEQRERAAAAHDMLSAKYRAAMVRCQSAKEQK